MFAHQIIIFATVIASPLPLDKVALVQIGDSKQVVELAWKDLGPVTSKLEEDGSTTVKVKANTANLCQGRVVYANQQLGDDFNAFASMTQILIEVHVQPLVPEIFAINGKRPASDPRGEYTLKSSAIRLRWASAPNYMLTYVDINDDRSVSESLIGNNPCKKPE